MKGEGGDTRVGGGTVAVGQSMPESPMVHPAVVGCWGEEKMIWKDAKMLSGVWYSREAEVERRA